MSYKINSTTGLLTFIALLLYLPVQAQWSTQKLSEGRSKAYPVVVGHKAFFIGGEIQNSGGLNSNVVDVYNDSTGQWSALNLSFTTRDYLNAPAMACNGKIFVIQTGESRTAVINIIDAATETVWQDTLSQSRNDLAMGAVGEWAVFAGGNSGEPSSRVDFYNTRTQQWTTAELSVARSFSVCGTLDNKLFIAGGFNRMGLSNRVDIFDAATGVWDTASLSVPRCMMEVQQVGRNLIFAGGGTLDFILYDAIDIYHADTRTWTTAKLSQQVYANVLNSAVAGNKAFFTGGLSPRNVDVYDATTDTWTTLTAPTSHQLNPVIALGSRVFFAGGLNNPAGQVDVYNTATDQWTNIGKLSVPRYYAAGAAVGNKVLFAGGIGNSAVVDVYKLPASDVSAPIDNTFNGILLPNPADDWAVLVFPEPVTGCLSLFDARGALVLRQDLEQTTQYELPLGALPAGRYIWYWAGREPGKSGSGQIVVVR